MSSLVQDVETHYVLSICMLIFLFIIAALTREERLERDLELRQNSGITKKDEIQLDESG